MNIRWLLLSVLCLCCHLSAQEFPRLQQFSALEQQSWQLTMQRPVGDSATVLAALPQDPTAPPAQQAWLLAQRCRFALQADNAQALDAARTALKRLEAASGAGEFAGSAAGYKCRQLSKYRAGESTETRQLSFLAYHSLTERDGPALFAWVALDYARDALASGFYDSAANAIGQVLTLARRNQLTLLETDSLTIQAEIYLAQGLYSEALRTSQQAFVLAQTAEQQIPLQLLQAEIFRATGRLAEAQALYQSLWQQQHLSAGLALLDLYLQQHQLQLAVPLSAALQLTVSQSGDRELLAISKLRQAMVLLAQGQVSAAQTAFADGSGWLSQHRLALYLPEQQRWAALLDQQGLHAEAFAALQQSMLLQRQLDAEHNSLQAQLGSALLIAEQRSRELKLVDLQQQLAAQQRQQTAAQRQMFWLEILCSALAGLLLLLIWRQLR